MRLCSSRWCSLWRLRTASSGQCYLKNSGQWRWRNRQLFTPSQPQAAVFKNSLVSLMFLFKPLHACNLLDLDFSVLSFPQSILRADLYKNIKKCPYQKRTLANGELNVRVVYQLTALRPLMFWRSMKSLVFMKINKFFSLIAAWGSNWQ